MKIKRVVLTEKPYPTCAVSGKPLGYVNPVYEGTQKDGKVVYVDAGAVAALFKTID